MELNDDDGIAAIAAGEKPGQKDKKATMSSRAST